MSAKKHLSDAPTGYNEHGYCVLDEKRRHERPPTNPVLIMLLWGGRGCGMSTERSPHYHTNHTGKE